MDLTHHFDLNPTIIDAPVAPVPPPTRGSSVMPSHRLNQALTQALDASDSALHLARYVERFHQQNPGRLSSQDAETVESLRQMLTHYVQLLPVLTEDFHRCCQHPQLQAPVNRLTTIICEFFEAIDPQRLKYGLIGVIDKAYFGHRLFEEFHDRLRLQAGQPMIQWDMALANLIVHSLIGDEYANRLDMAVMEVIDSLDVQRVEGATLSAGMTSDFQCLAMHHGLSMDIGSTRT